MRQNAIPAQIVGGEQYSMGRQRLFGPISSGYSLGKDVKSYEVELEDTSVIDYYEKGIPPKSKIPDNLPGVFD